MTASKYAANAEVKGPEAVSLMLFSSEVQYIQNYLSQLRDRRMLGIPQEVGQLNTNLSELESEILKTQREKALEEKRLAQLEPELNEKIENIEGKIKKTESKRKEKEIDIEELRNSLDTMIITQETIPPKFSEQPIPKKIPLYTAVGFAAGLFISIFLAFVLEFWKKNKEKIQG